MAQRERNSIRIKRVYDAPSAQDGRRILVDRLWPRGLTRSEASIDLWARDLAPSAALRKWYAHDPSRWEAFQARYSDELSAKDTRARLAALAALAAHHPITLLYAAKDRCRNNAVVLYRVLTGT